MYTTRDAFAALLISCVLTASAAGSTADRGTYGADTVGTLTMVAGWTAAATGLPLADKMPRVVRSTRSDMLEMRSGGMPRTGTPEQIEALYDTQTGTIYVPEGWTGATVSEMSVLVHEMVHHLQHAAGMHFACTGEREAAAYAAQAQFLALGGLNLAQAFDIDPLTLLVRTTCSY